MDRGADRAHRVLRRSSDSRGSAHVGLHKEVLMRRTCDECGTPLPGRKGHGLVIRGRLLCGRSKVEKSVRVATPTATDSGLRLRVVDTPGCTR